MFERFTVLVGYALSCWEIIHIKFKLNILWERETKEKEEEMILEKFYVGFVIWTWSYHDKAVLCVLRLKYVLTYIVKSLNRVLRSH